MLWDVRNKIVVIMGYNCCAAPGCTSRIGQGLIFKTYPRDEKLATLWRQLLPSYYKITSATVLCERHFDANQFGRLRADGKKKFKRTAVPTLTAYTRKAFGDITNTISAPHLVSSGEHERESGHCEQQGDVLALQYSPKPQAHPDTEVAQAVLLLADPCSISGDVMAICEPDPMLVVAPLDPVHYVFPVEDYENSKCSPSGKVRTSCPLAYDPEKDLKRSEMLAKQQAEIDLLKQQLEEKDSLIDKFNKIAASPPFRRKYRANRKCPSINVQELQKPL